MISAFFYGRKRRIHIVIYSLLLIAWLTFIFCNSASNGLESTEQSNRVVEFLQKLCDIIAPEVSVDVHLVRKTAHFCEFFLLGAMYYFGSFFIKKCRVSLFFHSLSLSLFSAFVDETIQIFSIGRSAQIEDMWIDFCGSLLAHIILFASYYTYKYIKLSK